MNLHEAVENFRTQAAGYRAMFDLADQLNDIDRMEQRAAEAEKRIAAAGDIEQQLNVKRAELAKAQDQLAAAQAKTAAAEDELAGFEKRLADARAKAAALLG